MYYEGYRLKGTLIFTNTGRSSTPKPYDVWMKSSLWIKKYQEQGMVAFQGTLKTLLSRAMSRVGSGNAARELKNAGRGLPGRAIPRGLWGGGSGTVRQESGWRRRVTKSGKSEPGAEREGMRGFPGQPDQLRASARRRSSPAPLGPGARWPPRQAARTLLPRGPVLLTFGP